MANYYNTSSGPLAIGLRRGGSALISPRKWHFIDSADEGSEDIVFAVKKGFLVRSAVDDVPEVKTVAPVVVQAPVEAAPEVSEVVSDPEPTEQAEEAEKTSEYFVGEDNG
jgi:hypothetical protein